MSIYDVFNKGKKEVESFDTFDKKAWAEQKQAQRQAAYELIEQTSQLMAKNPQAFKQYLNVQQQFDRYTATNAILVSAQMPQATQLKSFRDWKDSRIYVNPNPTKVLIIEPGNQYQREDGTTATSFNAKEVYDISQTSARIKTEGMEQKPMRELLAALIKASPVEFQPIDDIEVPAYYDPSQRIIFLSKDLSENELFNSMALEVAAAIYDIKHNEDRETSGFKSYCVSYMLSQKYGVDTSVFSFGQLPPELTEMEQLAFRSELNSMRDVLGEIHNEMYKELEKTKPEKAKDQAR